jgi:hypothetical protein
MTTTEKKLARIDHIRCGEYSACTFVWVRGDMTEDELAERVEAAEREYLATLKEFSEANKPTQRFSYRIEWEQHRDRAVGEVLDEHAAAQAEHNRYEKTRQNALRDFDHYLTQQEGITSFWEDEFPLHGEVDWGHMHGTKIEYGETEWPKFRLLKPTKRGAPGGTVMRVSDSEEWV